MSSGMTRLAIAVATIVALSMAGMQRAEAVTHVVGDTVTWTVPSSASTYSNWSSSYTFAVGDVLLFNFATGQHDVAEVTKANYDSCGTSSPMLLLTNGPANFTLNATETYYFICTIGNGAHCTSGQKVSVTVGSGSSAGTPTSSPPGTSTTTPSPPPPPAGSGAVSVATTSKLFLVSLAMIMGYIWM